MSWPSIDHSLLSPSGRMSKRARMAALERERTKLFGEKGLAPPRAPKRTPEQQADDLRQRASELRALADRGMRPRAHRAEAERLEREAQDILRTK